jgi:hypothetical protein
MKLSCHSINRFITEHSVEVTKTADVVGFGKYEGLHEHVTFSDQYNSYLRKSDNAKCYNYEK